MKKNEKRNPTPTPGSRLDARLWATFFGEISRQQLSGQGTGRQKTSHNQLYSVSTEAVQRATSLTNLAEFC